MPYDFDTRVTEESNTNHLIQTPLTSHTVLQLKGVTIQHTTLHTIIQNELKYESYLFLVAFTCYFCDYRVYPWKRASKVACAILVLLVTLVALPPTESSFTLALHDIIPLTLPWFNTLIHESKLWWTSHITHMRYNFTKLPCYVIFTNVTWGWEGGLESC